MRKYISIVVFTLCFIFALGAVTFAKDAPVKVYIDGTQKTLTPSAFSRGNKVYLPLISIVKAIGGSVTRDNKNKTYTVKCGSIKTVVSQSRGIMVNGQFMAPMMEVSTAIDYLSRWDKDNSSVYFTKVVRPKNQPAQPKPAGGG